MMLMEVSPLDEQLMSYCRTWYLGADDLLLAYQRLQCTTSFTPVHTGSSTATVTSTTSKQSVLQQLLHLHSQGLQDAVAKFIEFSEATKWHIIPEGGQQHPTLSTQTWWQIIDSEMLRRTVQVLELVRVPHTTHGFARQEMDQQPVRHTSRVGSFHDTLLQGIAVLLSGLQLAAHELWRPCLEQIMQPRDNGFLLMLADVLAALCQVARRNPSILLPVDPAIDNASTPDLAALAVPEQLPLQPDDSTTDTTSPHPLTSESTATTDVGFGSALPTPCVTRPSSAVASLRLELTTHSLSSLASCCEGTGEQQQQPDVGATFEAATDIQGSFISTSTAICVLRVLRDLNDLACNELSVRRGGAAGLNGLPSIRQFLDSLVDLRAGLAALLQHTDILSNLTYIFRACQRLGAPQRDVVPLLEGLVAVACTACSPDLPDAVSSRRRTQDASVARPPDTIKPPTLQPPVVAVITEQIHQVIHLVNPYMEDFQGVAFNQLPANAQALLSLLQRLCECMITYGSDSAPEQGATLQGSSYQMSPGLRRSTHPVPRYLANILPHRATKKNDATCEVEGDLNDLPGADLLASVVQDLLASIRIFACFAASDVIFFCIASDSWMPTIKSLARRCVSEGHTSLVKDITRVMCEVAAVMTHAMSHAAAAAAQADEEAQLNIFHRIKTKLSAGYVLSSDLQTEVFGKVMAVRGHPDRPYGWGAGAQTTGIHNLQRHQVTSTSTRRAMYGSSLAGGFTVETGNAARSAKLPGGAASSLVTQIALPAHGGLSSFSPRGTGSNSCGPSPRRLTGLSALLPSPRSNTSASSSPRFKPTTAVSAGGATPRDTRRMSSGLKLLGARRSSAVLDTAGGAAGVAAQLSELAPLWAALGYNADGQVVDMKVVESEDEEEPPQHWTGMPKQFVIHYEQLLQEVLTSTLHLIRGFLVPVMWQRLPQPLATELAAQDLQSQSASSATSPARASASGKAGQWGCMQRSASTKSPKTADQWKRAGLPAHLIEAEAQPVPRHICVLLGKHIFNGPVPPALPEDDAHSEVPESVICLIEELHQAGLLRTLETVFSLELMSDQMYWSHAAAVDSSTASLAKARDQGSRLDSCRVACACLVRDALSGAPAIAHDTQASLMLRAVRRFLNNKLQANGLHTHSHPLSKFTRCTPSTAIFKPPDTQKPKENILVDWRDTYTSRDHVTSTSHIHDRHGTLVDLTAYTVTSLVAMGLELLPLPRVLAARAEADQAPGLVLGSKWVANPAKVLAAGVAFIHTWSPFMSLLNILMQLMEAHERPEHHKAPIMEDTALKARFSTDPGKLRLDPSTNPGSPARDGAPVPVLKLPHNATASREISMHRRKSNFESLIQVEVDTDRTTAAVSAYQQARLKATRFKGSHLAASVQFLAPLHRLLEAWVQQLTHLLHRYQHMEVLQSCIEVGLLHSGAATFMMAVLKGQHYTLSCRFQPTEPQDQLKRLNSLTPMLDTQTSLTRYRNGQELTSTWVIPESLLQKRRVARDVDREYGLAGTALVSLEELCCIMHQLCARPAFSAHLIITNLMAKLVDVITSTLDKHLNANSNLVRTVAAASSTTTPRSPFPPGSVSTPRAVCLSPNKDLGSPWTPSTARSPRVGVLETGPGSSVMEAMVTTAARYQYLTMPRAGHWMLACCSTAKRAACGLSFLAAQLAFQRLNTGANAATAERYTTGKPNAGSATTLSASPATTQQAVSPAEPQTQAVPAAAAQAQGAADAAKDQGAHTEDKVKTLPQTSTGKQSDKAGSGIASQIRPADQMVIQQPQMLKQYCRQLLIACRNSLVGVELVDALSVLPGILDPASQLRSVQVTSQPMTAVCVQAALEAGVEIAAVAVAHGTSKATTALNSPVTGSMRPSADGAGDEEAKVVPASEADASFQSEAQNDVASTPATPAEAEVSFESELQGREVEPGLQDVPLPLLSRPKSKRPLLAVQIPGSKDVTASSAASPRPDHLGQTTGQEANKARATVAKGGLQGWESQAAVLMCEELSDPSVLQEERLKAQRAQLEAVMDQISQGSRVLSELPLPSLSSACPVLVEKPQLLGCCNIKCGNLRPGQTEKDVSLHRCERCERTWYCCEACQIEAWPQHRQFCSWFEALQRL